MADNQRAVDYHNDFSRDSHSTLEVYRDSPPKYKAMFVDKVLEKKQSDAFDVGSAFHTFMLEPAKFQERYAVAPVRWKLNTKDGKDSLAKFEIDNPGKAILWPEEYKIVEGMAMGVMSNSYTRDLMMLETSEGNIERIINWEDPATGLPLRAMIDKLVEMDEKIVVADLKSCADVSEREFGKSAANYGYHRQEDMYRRAVAEFGKPVEFHFVAAEKSYPFEAGDFTMHPDDVKRANRENHDLMSEVLFSKQTGQYPSRIGGRQNVVRLPKYAYSAD